MGEMAEMYDDYCDHLDYDDCSCCARHSGGPIFAGVPNNAWVAKGLGRILISSIDSEHLTNILNMLERRGGPEKVLSRWRVECLLARARALGVTRWGKLWSVSKKKNTEER
jgi:hypothetical protein